VRRAGKQQRPGAWQLLRIFLGHSGAYEYYFAQSARTQLETGSKREALLAATRAFRASPPHAVRDMLRGSDLRWALLHLALPGRTQLRREP